jgi:hypothetical protein
MMPLVFSLLLVLLSTIVLFIIIQYLLRSHNWKQIEFHNQRTQSPENEPRGKKYNLLKKGILLRTRYGISRLHYRL